MTPNLKHILDELLAQIKNFNAGVVKSEEEFINSLKTLNTNFTAELAKPQGPPEEKK